MGMKSNKYAVSLRDEWLGMKINNEQLTINLKLKSFVENSIIASQPVRD